MLFNLTSPEVPFLQMGDEGWDKNYLKDNEKGRERIIGSERLKGEIIADEGFGELVGSPLQ